MAPVELLGETGHGVIRIERDVSAAGFEDGEDGDHEVGGAVEGEADEGIGADAEGAQVVREVVGAFVELAVGELLIGKA